MGVVTKLYIGDANNKAAELKAGASSLSELEDTSITSPINGQVMKYNSTLSKWVNSSQNIVLIGLLEAGETEFTFTDNAISSNVGLAAYGWDVYLPVSDYVVDGTSCTCTFEAQESDVYVALVITEGMPTPPIS